MVHLPQTSIFLGKTINIIFIYLLTHSIVQNFKQFLQQNQNFEDVPLDPKLYHLPQRKCFRKPVDKPSSYHACLYAFQKSKSDINLLMKY